MSEPHKQIFQDAYDRAERAREIAEDDGIGLAELRNEFAALNKDFSRLLKQAAKITHLGDLSYRKLIRLRDQLQARNEQISQQQEALLALNRRLEEASLTDSLTGLRNRRYLVNFIETDVKTVLRRGEVPTNGDLVFIMVDVDHFKKVNDAYGHAAGDLVLVQVAKILSETCRASDIVARWGGEEFLLVLRESSRNFAAETVERIRADVADRHFDIGACRQLSLTCSVGFASFPFVADQPDLFHWEQVVGLADNALYAAKAAGRDAWFGMEAVGHWPTILPGERPDPKQLLDEGYIRLFGVNSFQRPETGGR